MKRKNIRLLPPIALDERQRQQMYQLNTVVFGLHTLAF